MEMVGHDLHFVQLGIREMIRYSAPAFIYDTAHIGQFNLGCGIISNDPTGTLFSGQGAKGHEIDALRVFVVM